MAKKKAAEPTASISFKCPAELADALKDLAFLSRRDVSSLLVEVAGELVKANKDRIKKFRQSAAQPIKMPSFTPTSKNAAQKTAPTLNDDVPVEGSEPV